MTGLPRIVILGGGVGAVTAAVNLSQPGWQEHFGSITMYQQGWRLGGKGASGRGRDRRIEEHGLHVWFGCYHNAFRMLGGCHAELDERERHGEARWPLAFASMQDSLLARTEISLTDHDGCDWKLWEADFFDNDESVPWQPADRRAEPTVLSYLRRSLYLAATLVWSLVASEPDLDQALEIVRPGAAPPRRTGLVTPGSPAAGTSGHSDEMPFVLRLTADALDALPQDAADRPGILSAIDLVLRTIDTVYDVLMRRFGEVAQVSDAVRRAGYVADLLLAIARGMIEDDLVGTDSFAPIDHLDFREWLLAHGATPESVDCVLVRTIVYDLPFAYEGGDPRRPAAAAGTSLRSLMGIFFSYRGAIMWKMNAGMGDVVFAPLYELLVKRGVDVRFFHRVEQLTAGGGGIESITIDVQTEIPPATEPSDYLMDRALWPADPREIHPFLDMRIAPEAYESWYLGRRAAWHSTTTLQRGAPGDDGFELVVFGLPISCVPHVAPDLVDQSALWRAAVDHVVTVPTQALQLWLDRPAPDLSHSREGTILGGYTEPFDTWADMSQLVAQEQVNGCATVAYFCNVLEDAAPPIRGSASAAQWLADQGGLVYARALRFLRRDIANLWPQAIDPVTGELDWNVLLAPASVTGSERLQFQYWRANIEPSERYVLSIPGSGVHRIPPGDTGFANLYTAGDWTSCLLDGGYVEAAVVSGILAANAIHLDHGSADSVQPIIGWGP
jgi:uncharacterized protein with NAD-binding domain and iron-sulfur cluster